MAGVPGRVKGSELPRRAGGPHEQLHDRHLVFLAWRQICQKAMHCGVATVLLMLSYCAATYLDRDLSIAAAATWSDQNPCVAPMRRNALRVNQFQDQFRAGTVRHVDVQDEIDWQGASLKPPVNSKGFTMEDVRFFRPVHLAYGSFMGSISLTGVAFCTDVDLSHSSIDGYLVLQHVYFAGQAAFELINVARQMSVREAKFVRGADFTRAGIGDSFRICSAEFDGNTTDFTDFEQMHVGRNMELGKLDSNPSCEGPKFTTEVDFSGAKISNNFDVSQAQFLGPLTSFDNVQVGKRARFGPARSLPHEFSLGAMSYYDIKVAPIPGKSGEQALLDFVGRSTYSSETYATLADYYRRVDPPFVNSVFVRGKQRERITYLRCAWQTWSTCITRGLNLILLDWAVGYGRHTERVIILGVTLVLIAWALFRNRADMNPVPPNTGQMPYHGLVYSLDLFVPGVDLGMAKIWTPQPNFYWLTYVYKFIGWLLVPIAVVYIAGFVK